ncbi:hypothetical protein BASA62_000393 [Batrachochytrium salamandrivorans]|nr:hypothetical protein BASA62_000393 [Batrachochytrium salamandrivorans]
MEQEKGLSSNGVPSKISRDLNGILGQLTNGTESHDIQKLKDRVNFIERKNKPSVLVNKRPVKTIKTDNDTQITAWIRRVAALDDADLEQELQLIDKNSLNAFARATSRIRRPGVDFHTYQKWNL